ncbi:hypothetical protein GMI70_02860 [Eggerthellaceae bacterium zg-893]|nr:hypothetical protein [Eggerthellaceae bacterium zg-893]
MRGRAVRVERVEDGETVVETVDGVLVARPQTNSISDADQPEAAPSAVDLAFPRPYCASLRGASVEVDGRSYRVAGNPAPDRANAPTRWWMVARAYEAAAWYSQTAVIERAEHVRSECGDVRAAWSRCFEVSCTAEVVSAGEEASAKADAPARTVRLTAPYSDELAALDPDATGYRFVWEGDPYEIKSVENVGYADDRIEIEGVLSWQGRS